jgi:hypothetical protein
VEDVDRDIDTARRHRGRCKTQIETHLEAVAVLRSKHARSATRLDELLDERLGLLNSSD